jgi:hypothetical protein
VKRSLREVLADSHIAAVTIAVLLLWAVNSGFQALWIPLSKITAYLFTAVAIFDIPYFSYPLNVGDRSNLILATLYLLSAAFHFAAAWILSRWVYGLSPLASLSQYRASLTRRTNV